MKTITIPKSPSPFEVIINGVKHTYEAGTTVEVEDYIAEVIERTIFKFTPDPGGISWNDLTDKPFGESATGGDTLTWDGNTEGLVSLDLTDVMGFVYYKVSDAVPTEADIAGNMQVKMADGSIIDGLENSMPFDELGMLYAAGLCLVVTTDTLIDGLGMIKKGVYFTVFDGNYISSLTIPNYTGFPGVKRMEEKYMPLLTAPNGTKYKISVSDDGKLTATAV